MATELWKFTGTQLHELVKSKQLTQDEILNSYRARIQQINPSVNAIIDDMTALVVPKPNQEIKNLTGFAVTFKDTVDVAGRVNSRGVSNHRNQIAKWDNPFVKNIRDQDALMVGRTNCAPIGLRWFTENDLYGTTLNPFDSNITAGGSSGGAAVAVATGMCSVAHGSDYSGSVRYPAWMCGVYGFRPTMNLIPSVNFDWQQNKYFDKSLLLQLFSTEGIMARSIDDIQTVFEVMKSRGGSDPNWIPHKHDYAAGPEKLRIGVCLGTENTLSDSIMAAINDVIKYFINAGHKVEWITVPQFDNADILHNQILRDQFLQNRSLIENIISDTKLIEVYDKYCDISNEIPKQQLIQKLGQRHQLMAELTGVFNNWDLILTPVCFEDGLGMGEDNKNTIRTHEIFKAMKMQTATSFLGTPGLSVPIGMHSGRPTGVQLLCSRFHEHVLFKAGRELESAFGFNSLDHLT